MKFFSVLALVFSTSTSNSVAATILSVEKVSIAGAHGMAVIAGNKVLLTDTFKLQDTARSQISEVSDSKVSQVDFQGVGLSGITPIPTGYLICDLQGSIVYKINKQFKVDYQWQVKHPWIAKADNAGNIFALTYSGLLLLLNPNGRIDTLISNLDAPFDFEFNLNSDGIWISEQGKQDGKVALWKLDVNKQF